MCTYPSSISTLRIEEQHEPLTLNPKGWSLAAAATRMSKSASDLTPKPSAIRVYYIIVVCHSLLMMSLFIVVFSCTLCMSHGGRFEAQGLWYAFNRAHKVSFKINPSV